MRKKIFENSGSADKIHDELIRSVVTQLEGKGFMVRANHIHHPNGTPRTVKGYTPDIHAFKNLKEIIIEVETCKTIHSDNLLKWRRFSFNNGRRFWLVVPPCCKESAEMKKEVFNLPMEVYCSNLNGKLDKVNV
ncbi:hypothetical protein HYG87_10570 [Methanobacterium alkalithermotolerans]|uniref:Uncharacterized protein n=1 Tax=Methanobacterium alkalithermotolerans TaxID=2731220 RepID=A0A8T8K809_9EURY|nr:hypothetical protein [Methanobacterium alkalithermotolerans]QUH24167.1 hypothetical protein HYG87_10570 [Methanobacterium alkalithermotolerans]RJS49552.1 MAG: hypothetical protein CIT03_01810 [Methanobacterium sp.]